MKEFITKFGRGLIDLFAVIVLIGIILMSIGEFNSYHPLNGLVILISGMIIFILSFYLLYLLIDIKDNTTSINNLLSKYLSEISADFEPPYENMTNMQNRNTSTKSKYSSKYHTVKCLKCGNEFNVIGKDDALCPQCGFLYKNQK